MELYLNLRTLARFPRAVDLLPMVCLCLGLQAATVYHPQLTDPLRESWRWTPFPELDGGQGWHCVQTRDGALWFGSRPPMEKGVLRYDGTRWQHFTARDGLLHDAIYTLCPAQDGALYVGTERGLNRFQEGKWQRVWPAEGDDACVYSVVETSDGSVWGGLDNGLLRWSDSSVQVFTSENFRSRFSNSVPQVDVVIFPETVVPGTAADFRFGSLVEDREGGLWAVCQLGMAGIVHWKPQADARAPVFERFDERDGLQMSAWPQQVYCTPSGEIWTIGTAPGDAVQRWERPRWKWVESPDRFRDCKLSLVQTRDGVTWIGGQGRLHALAKGTWRSYEAGDYPIPKDRVSLFESADGALWISSEQGETWRLDYSSEHWMTYEGLHFQGGTSDGTEWFITAADGVAAHRPNSESWIHYGPDDGLMETVTTLLITRNGEIWAGGSRRGQGAVARFNGTRWEDQHPPAFGHCVGYRSLFEAADASLWFGSEVLLAAQPDDATRMLRYSPAAERTPWTTFAIKEGAGIAQSAAGRILVGGLGLRELLEGRFQPVENPVELKRWVDNLYTTRSGEVWAAVGGLGAYRYNGTDWQLHSVKDGLAHNVVSTFLELADGSLLAATPKGLSRFDGRTWTPQAFPPELAFDREGGTLRQSADGALWINRASREWYLRAGLDAPLAPAELAKVRATRYRPDRLPPDTRFTDVPDVVAQPGNAYIAWRGSDVWRRSADDQLRYSYRFNQGEWSDYTPATSRNFLRLAPGAYTLELRARDGDFNVDPTPATVRFRVLPPVWRQPWFVGLMGAVAAALGFMEFRVLRRNALLRHEVVERKQAQATVEQQNVQLAEQNVELDSQKTQLVAHKDRLELEIDQRRRLEAEKERIHQELLLTSRRAGMAEVATSVLHNVGNVLNSLNVSANLLAEKLHDSRTASVTKVAALLREHAHDLPAFLTQDERGQKLPDFLTLLAASLDREQQDLRQELTSLRDHIEHIRAIVMMQQGYARVCGVLEQVSVRELVEDALKMHAGAFERNGLRLERRFTDVPLILTDRHQVLQILVNLLHNAQHACHETGRADGRVTVTIEPRAADRVAIEVRDDGIGIAPENLLRVFNHGFTTRRDGHGFGLHSGAIAAKQLGGELSARSDGPGRGACFTLELPLQAPSAPSPAGSGSDN